MPSAELTMTQIRERGIPERIKDKDLLSGLPEIAAYLECSVSTTRRLIKLQGLPATASAGRAAYKTTKTLIQAWIRESHLRRVERFNWI